MIYKDPGIVNSEYFQLCKLQHYTIYITLYFSVHLFSILHMLPRYTYITVFQHRPSGEESEKASNHHYHTRTPHLQDIFKPTVEYQAHLQAMKR